MAYNQLRNAPYHNNFLPLPANIELVGDEEIIRNHRLTSSVDKKFIENKQDNSTDTLKEKEKD